MTPGSLPPWPTRPVAQGPVVLRQFSARDVPMAQELSTDPYVPFVGTLPANASREQALDWVDRQRGRWAEGEGFSFAIAEASTAGASIVANTVGRVLVETVSPSDSRRGDVRDRDVSRFGEHASRWFLVAGAAAALVMAMAKVDYFWIANVIYLGFVLWAVAGSVLKLVAYRRGL